MRPTFCKAAIAQHIQTVIDGLEKLSAFDKGERRFTINVLKKIQTDIRMWSGYRSKVHGSKAMSQQWRALWEK